MKSKICPHLFLYPVFIACFCFCGPLLGDDKYVYDGIFAGTAVDDGNNNLEIADALFGSFKANVDSLNTHPGPSFSGILLDSMLEIRAFYEQRVDKVRLTAEQKELYAAIKTFLTPLKLDYHANQRQKLVDLCAKDDELTFKLQNFAKTFSSK